MPASAAILYAHFFLHTATHPNCYCNVCNWHPQLQLFLQTELTQYSHSYFAIASLPNMPQPVESGRPAYQRLHSYRG
ncbi:hypothetical protein EDC01DRAFT_665974 [Geopyxis carbonaria]|nr:hypothetical protein EDC01DRAFT_665974 [Geopyxis carbonaria]